MKTCFVFFCLQLVSDFSFIVKKKRIWLTSNGDLSTYIFAWSSDFDALFVLNFCDTILCTKKESKLDKKVKNRRGKFLYKTKKLGAITTGVLFIRFTAFIDSGSGSGRIWRLRYEIYDMTWFTEGEINEFRKENAACSFVLFVSILPKVTEGMNSQSH